MKIAILDAWLPDDPALVNSHWVAERTHEVLVEHEVGFEVVVVADQINQDRIRAELATPHDGFAYFGHGRDCVLYQRCDERDRPLPLLDGGDISLIGHRWFHAFACLTGNTLAFDAVDHGVAAYLGYNIAVNVEWEPLQLPTEVAARLRDLVTTATLMLALGERSRQSIGRAVRSAAIRLQRAANSHRAQLEYRHILGLNALASALHRDMQLQGTDVQP